MKPNEDELVEKLEAFNVKLENEVINGQRDPRTLFAIPSNLIKSAKVTFPENKKEDHEI